MPNAYKVLGQIVPQANTANTLYTVPAGRSAIVSSINVCNPSISNNIDVRLAIVPSGETLAQRHYVAFGLPVPLCDSINLSLGLTLAANDSIIVYANNATNMSFAAFGLEVF